MYLTCQMIISILTAEGVNILDYSHASNIFVQRIERYDTDATSFSGDVLYIAPLEEAISADAGLTLSFLCTCSGTLPATLITPNSIAIASGIDITELCSRAYQIFTELNRWIIDLQNSVIANEGVQALLDLSRSVFKNTIILMDLTCKLLACSPGTSDGSQSLRFDRRIKELMELLKLNTSTGTQGGVLTVSASQAGTQFPMLQKCFRLSKVFSIYAVMFCSDDPPSLGMIDLFELLCHFIEEYVKRGYPYDGKYSAFDSLLQDFLDGRLTDSDEISLRASRVSIPCTGCFDLYKLDLTDATNQPLAYLALTLQSKLPNSHISVYQKAIVILNLYDGEAALDRIGVKNLTIIREVMGNQILGIGVSNPFSSLSDFKRAFLQAEAGLSVGSSRPAHERVGTTEYIPPVYHFEDLYVDYLLRPLRGGEGGIYDNSFARQTVNRLLDLQKRQNYNYIGFLYTYLMAERRPSVVGRQLQLHRNTVIYHIHKVEEALGFSLEDPHLRLKLLVEISSYLHTTGDTAPLL